MMYSCVLFDLDHTLLVKRPTVWEKVEEMLLRCNGTADRESLEKAYAESELWQGEQIRKESESGIRMDDEEFFRRVASFYHAAAVFDNEMERELNRIVSGDYEKHYQLMPDAQSTLEQLKRSGVKLGIVSNHTSAIRKIIENMGLDQYFDTIVISEEAGLSKPDPEILRLACERLGVRCEESIYVGDHPYDILCAHRAAMPVVWVPVNRYFRVPDWIGRPEHTVANLAELVPVLLQSR